MGRERNLREKDFAGKRSKEVTKRERVDFLVIYFGRYGSYAQHIHFPCAWTGLGKSLALRTWRARPSQLFSNRH